MEKGDLFSSGNNSAIQFTFCYTYINKIQYTLNFSHSVSNEHNLSVRLLQPGYDNRSKLS